MPADGHDQGGPGDEVRRIRDRLLAEQAAKAKPNPAEPTSGPHGLRAEPQPDAATTDAERHQLVEVMLNDPAIMDMLREAIGEAPATSPKYKKRKKPQPSSTETMADLNDIGQQYTKPARCVIMREGMSPLSRAIYWFLDALCYDGRFDRKEQMVAAPEYKVKVSLSQIARHFAIDRKTVKKGIDELRDAAFIYKEAADFKPGQYDRNTYELPFRKRRLEYDEEHRQRRREAREQQSGKDSPRK